MPLKPGSSKQVIHDNIKMLILEGKPPSQAAAIAHDHARRDKKKKK